MRDDSRGVCCPVGLYVVSLVYVGFGVGVVLASSALPVEGSVVLGLSLHFPSFLCSASALLILILHSTALLCPALPATAAAAQDPADRTTVSR